MNLLYQNVQCKFCYIHNLFEVEASMLVANPVKGVMVDFVLLSNKEDNVIPQYPLLTKPCTLLCLCMLS